MAGKKRKQDDDSSKEVYSNKSRAKASYEARVDPTYGQRSAIPGLDFELLGDDETGDLNYDDEGLDALNYLRAVRQEASSIPTLLVAPRDPVEEGTYEDAEGGDGWYEDGAYYSSKVHAADSGSSATTDEYGQEDPHLAYFDSILTRYEVLRAQLQQTPPVEALRKLQDDHPTHLGRLNKELARSWRWRLRTMDPVPAQIASMDKGTVLRLLGLLTGGTLLKRGSEVDVGVSRWAWALLARLPDSGELTSEEIGVVRELGKKAVLVGMGLKQERAWEEGIEVVEAGFDREREEDEEYEMTRGDEPVGDGLGGEVANDDEIDLDEAGSEPANPDDKDEEISVEVTNGKTSEPSNSGKATVEEEDVSGSTEEEGEVDEEGEVSEASAAEALEEAKARLLNGLNTKGTEDSTSAVCEDEEVVKAIERIAKWNTKATVDMIITVTGEMYGQRDLLEFRTVWSEIE